MFKNVLLATDGSAISLQAAQEVAALVDRAEGVQVTIALAINPLDTEQTDYEEEFVARANASMRAKAQDALARTERPFTERGITCQTKVITGDPVSAAIAREASAGGYDVIAMASRGLGMQKNDLHYLGSVTEHVIRRVSLPVLVIPLPRPDAAA